uniref:Uncharacterized protein n=1 Tax=Oryza punctata TaxID=4537 RepID=A0A0E0KN07_ORYPU
MTHRGGDSMGAGWRRHVLAGPDSGGGAAVPGKADRFGLRLGMAENECAVGSWLEREADAEAVLMRSAPRARRGKAGRGVDFTGFAEGGAGVDRGSQGAVGLALSRRGGGSGLARPALPGAASAVKMLVSSFADGGSNGRATINSPKEKLQIRINSST